MKSGRRDDARGRGSWQGMNWIRQEKRLAIYLRDGLACVWCGTGVEDAPRLTLDHVVPHSRGGSNDARNLVTACERCNSSRADRGAPTFAKAVAAYLNRGMDAAEILRGVRATTKRPLDLDAAREMISRRGSVAKVLRG